MTPRTASHYIGIQTDVTQRVEAEIEGRRALEAEREARAEAESARSRVSFLIEAMNQLTATLDVEESTARLLSLVVPYLADWALLLPSDRYDQTQPTSRHRHAARQRQVEDLATDLPTGFATQVASDLFSGHRRVQLLDCADPADLLGGATDSQAPGVAEHLRTLGGSQALIMALSGRSHIHDILVLVRSPGRQPFNEPDVDMALDLGRRAGMILENASLYQTQARIAEVLQRSLLPALTPVAGIESAARYLANESSAEIGGDFYELLDFHQDGLGIAIGDVNGHDILAAAAMGHLKGLLRAAAFEDFAAPAAVLEKVDRLILGLGMPTIATAVYAHVARDDDGWTLTWSGAGHPPLVLRHPDGAVEVLPVELNDTLLGLQTGRRTTHEIALRPGTTVVGYTDGLVERRGEPLDHSLGRLAEAVGTAPHAVEELCDHLLDVMSHGTRDDDIALLAVTLG
ncbi:PP2C family protein-serine/threonine phosphatase [Nocardioides dongxiaopingii]|uniref:PP2C family protein-serine/threonine phosphatase n=1 Tax=Nocardioides sp. S-1144 TaxID=2582905 RepID=UPI0021CB3924|nr:PP2C family protein-serine/threonine phosphatase [Nocardioides sp. S-1144]